MQKENQAVGVTRLIRGPGGCIKIELKTSLVEIQDKTEC